jgi:hypothetical protein
MNCTVVFNLSREGRVTPTAFHKNCPILLKNHIKCRHKISFLVIETIMNSISKYDWNFFVANGQVLGHQTGKFVGVATSKRCFMYD